MTRPAWDDREPLERWHCPQCRSIFAANPHSDERDETLVVFDEPKTHGRLTAYCPDDHAELELEEIYP
jgi:hypothetical protein